MTRTLVCAFNKRIVQEFETKLREDRKDTKWSEEQNGIFNWFEEIEGNLVVTAYAGTGKSTTILEGARRVPNSSIEVKTLHSVGYAAVRKFWEGIKVDFGSTRADALAEKVCGPTAPDTIKKLVSKLHTKGREIAPHATVSGQLTELAITFECEPDEAWDGTGYDLAYVERKALEAMELAATVKPVETGIDGADMIFLPVRNGWLHKQYDLVIVDEAQDMTVAQLEIAQGVCRGQICVVGDPNQAIYGFRGADSGSIARLQSELHARELGLTTTYRCGRAIVELAQAFVPDFTAGPNNPDGAIETLGAEKLVTTAGPGDFILSRLNAPLVSVAMSLLRSGKRARVAGRDIGAGLKTLVRKMKARTIPEMLARISAWEDKQVARLRKANRPDRIEAIHDQAEMLISLTDNAKNVDEVVARIDALFTDDGLGSAGVVTCSSVHRAKGLEADRVFILQATLRDYNQEEKNIQYVAITRAKKTLVWVV